MKKRINTAKWIESAKRWQINVQKDGVRKTFTCSEPGRTGQRICNAKADEWLDDNIKSTVKVSAMYEKWLDEVKLLKSNGTYTNYKCIGENHILPRIGKKKMSALSEQDFQDIINQAFKQGLSKRTLCNINGAMQTFLKYCRKCRTTTLHLEDIEISDKASSGEKKALQPEDLNILLNSVDYKGFWYLNAFKFFALTGLRLGELLALEKKDYCNGILNITKACNKFGEITKGKTKNASRSFMLMSVADEVIQDQLERIKDLKTEYIFPNQFGEIASGNSLYVQWKRFCKSNHITEISLHELRHTFISMCKNVPLELLKQVVGHSKAMNTFGQYGHTLEGEKELAKNLIEKEITIIRTGKEFCISR